MSKEGICSECKRETNLPYNHPVDRTKGKVCSTCYCREKRGGKEKISKHPGKEVKLIPEKTATGNHPTGNHRRLSDELLPASIKRVFASHWTVTPWLLKEEDLVAYSELEHRIWEGKGKKFGSMDWFLTEMTRTLRKEEADAASKRDKLAGVPVR